MDFVLREEQDREQQLQQRRSELQNKIGLIEKETKELHDHILDLQETASARTTLFELAQQQCEELDNTIVVCRKSGRNHMKIHEVFIFMNETDALLFAVVRGGTATNLV